ncbi:hypothetical protein [Pseudomonas proteolytica]|uniref:hypothetical protein n=1 Tax=Pseudomonas proteolytica TaxID=219574 RepID=UPI0021CC8CA8|nr:hypothetical protein [Pseudomonas proteolytica]
MRSVGPDKLNQLRQVRFLKDLATMKALMEQHRLLLKPRFDRVEAVFRWKLGRHGFARWTRPNGGYFVSLEVLPGTATKVVCSGLMKPDTHLGENARHIEVSDDQATSCLFR